MNLIKIIYWNFYGQVDLLLLNGDVTQTLLDMLNFTSIEELFGRLNLDLLLETNGTKIVTFIYGDGYVMQKLPSIIQNPVDPVGAGDSFFSAIIRAYSRYIEMGRDIDRCFVDNSFLLANNLAKKVVQTEGCRLSKQTMQQWIEEISKEQELEHEV